MSELLDRLINESLKNLEGIDYSRRPACLDSRTIKNEKDVAYLIEKLYELENVYRKVRVIAKTEDDVVVAALPALSIIDGTDLTEGLSTIRNTLNGLLIGNKVLKVEVY
jgi:hypothetical protein